jgi:hypothetical protein
VRPEPSRREVADPGRWRALAVTQFAAFMVLLDVSIVNVALPSIERGLAVPPATAQWVISGYAFGLGADVGSRGPARRFPRAAPHVPDRSDGIRGDQCTDRCRAEHRVLIAARLLQGVAGAMLIPQNSGLIQQLFRSAERGRAFGILGPTVGLATAAGPVIGGLILALARGPDDWRWVYRPGAARFPATRRWRTQPADTHGRRRQRRSEPACGRCGGWLRCSWRCSAGGRCAPGGGKITKRQMPGPLRHSSPHPRPPALLAISAADPRYRSDTILGLPSTHAFSRRYQYGFR